MKIDDAIDLIRSKYEENKDKGWIIDPVAYTLYEVWRISDSSQKTPYRPRTIVNQYGENNMAITNVGTLNLDLGGGSP